MNPAIVISTYNRPNSLRRVLSSVSEARYDNTDIPLVISIDGGGDNNNDLFKIAEEFDWEYGGKQIIRHKENLGLRQHILKCGDLTNKYGAIIMLEDDIVVSPYYYKYATLSLDFYKDDGRIAGVSLYSFAKNHHNEEPFMPLRGDSDVYFMQCAQSWGQLWWASAWNKFSEWYDKNKSKEFDPENGLPASICGWPESSWLKYHTRYCIENELYFVYPYLSISTNYGDMGTHFGQSTNMMQVVLWRSTQKEIALEELSDSSIRYDGFFENQNIIEFIKEKEDKEVTIDFYNQKGHPKEQGFLLTTRLLPHKVIRSYALDYKPYEENVLRNNLGEDLFLYDTGVKANKPKTLKGSIQRYTLLYSLGIFAQIKQLGIKVFLRLVVKKMLLR